MRLTPAEILRHLGLDVPDEGVEIDPHDAYLCTKSLQLLGRTMSPEAISERDVHELDQTLCALHGLGPTPADQDSIAKLCDP